MIPMTESKPTWGIKQTPLPQGEVVYALGIMRVGIRCTKTKKNGRICNHLLCKVDVDRWEETLTDAREDVCEGCGQTYTLAEYR